MSKNLFAPYQLPSGVVLPNRLVKAAMEEFLQTPDHLPDESFYRLYRRWARGGAGVLVTGNVMVHDAALTNPEALVLDERHPLGPFQRWAQVVHQEGSQIWMQLSHPGRQVLASMPGVAWAPSASRVSLGSQFAEASAMSQGQIEQVIGMFVSSAFLACQAGFDGVQVHAAHGYLISQFLSPRVNQRSDAWGGSLENRARLLREIVTGIRSRVPADFVLAVKLNSSDFQRGGFGPEEAGQVLAMLADCGADLVELSGGSYESPAMLGFSADSRTRAREAYFLELAQSLVGSSPLPLMVTGGVVRRSVAQRVLDSGVDLVGLGTALAADPDLVNRWQSDSGYSPVLPSPRIRSKAVASAASMAWVRWQMGRLAAGKEPQLGLDPRLTLLPGLVGGGRARRAYGRWLQERNS